MTFFVGAEVTAIAGMGPQVGAGGFLGSSGGCGADGGFFGFVGGGGGVDVGATAFVGAIRGNASDLGWLYCEHECFGAANVGLERNRQRER